MSRFLKSEVDFLPNNLSPSLFFSGLLSFLFPSPRDLVFSISLSFRIVCQAFENLPPSVVFVRCYESQAQP